MKFITFYALAAFLLPMTGQGEDLKETLHNALDSQASAPSDRPMLPDRASARAKFVQENVAHGENGEKERAEHAQKSAEAAASHRERGADATASGAANRSAQAAAASAAKSADTDSQAAAGQARAAEARGGNVPGSGGPEGHPGHQPPGRGRTH